MDGALKYAGTITAVPSIEDNCEARKANIKGQQERLKPSSPLTRSSRPEQHTCLP